MLSHNDVISDSPYVGMGWRYGDDPPKIPEIDIPGYGKFMPSDQGFHKI